MNPRHAATLMAAQACLGFGLWGCTAFMRPPSYAEADALRASNHDWGESGDYCAEQFRARVAGTGELPTFIATQRAACASGDGSACRLWAIAEFGACGGVARDVDNASVVMFQACDLGEVDACVDFVYSTPERWPAWRNAKRERARRRAIELSWGLCRTGTIERCRTLATWYRERRLGLVQGEFDRAERLSAWQCEDGGQPAACQSLLDQSLASANTEAAAAIVVDACRCRDTATCTPLMGILRSRTAPAAFERLMAIVNRLLGKPSCFTCAGAGADVSSGTGGQPGNRLPGIDTTVRSGLLGSCHGGDETACRSLLRYALSVDDDFTALGVGLSNCGLGRGWACDELQAIATATTRSVGARRRASELLCALNVQPGRPEAHE